jgi:hypothetical protein
LLPQALANLALAPASDSGTKGDDTTDVTTPAITGIGEAGNSITLYVDGKAVVSSAKVRTHGTWSVNPITALALSAHNMAASQTNSVLGTSGKSAVLKITIVGAT